MFDLAEQRFDDLLAQAVAAAPAGALEFCRHGGLARAFGPLSGPGGILLVVARPTGGQITGDPTSGGLGEVVLGAVAGVGGSLLGVGAPHPPAFFFQPHHPRSLPPARSAAP